MSVSFSCDCGERKKPVQDRNWEVLDYKCHHSAFSGYHETTSDYSTVSCQICGACGRTKAAYVDELVAAGKYRDRRGRHHAA